MFRIVLISLSLCMNAIASTTHTKPVIAVTEFQQEVDHYYDGCKGYHWRHQNQLKTVLESALAEFGFRVVERQHIRKMYNDEFQMDNLDPSTKSQAKKFKAARYAVTGGITELGICEEEQETGINVGNVVSLLGGPSTDLSLNLGGAVSKVKLNAKLINVETGVVLKVFESETESKDKSFGVDASVMGIGGNHKRASTPPIERATNEGLKKIAKEIADYLN